MPVIPDILKNADAEKAVVVTFLQNKQFKEAERQREAAAKISIYNDDWKTLLEKKIRNEFHPDNAKKIQISADTSQNLLKKAVNEISLVYKKPPIRKFEPENDKVSEIYGNIEKEIFLKEINEYMNLVNDVLIEVRWDEETKNIILYRHTPDNLNVIQKPNKPGEARAVLYRHELTDTPWDANKWFVYWSDEHHFLMDDKFNKLKPSKENKKLINPYGSLPFVFVHKKRLGGSSFWNNLTGNDMVEGCLLNGMSKTHKRHLIRYNCWKQMWMSGRADEKMDTVLMLDPATVLSVPDPAGKVGILDIQANFDQLDKAILKDANDFLNLYGLSIDMFHVQIESGRAIKIKSRPLKEIRDDQIKIFRKVEQDLFNKARMVWNYHNPFDQIPDTTKLITDFAEMEVEADAMQELTLYTEYLKKGILTIGQYYMKFNPDVKNEKKAEKIILENLDKLVDTFNMNIEDMIGSTPQPAIEPGDNAE